MRNFLLFLTLCALTLTASNVFAEGYDASRRTERLGLSFYDGRALYVAYIKVYPSLGRPEEHSFELERLHTGQSIEDMANSYNPDADQGYFGQDGKYLIYGYYSVETDGSLKLITDGSFANYPESAPYHWLSKYLLTYKPGISAEDLAVETYDNILPNAQDWARRGILLAVALLVISAGSNKFRELTSGETQKTAKDAKKSDGAASPKAEKPKFKKKIVTSEYLELEHENPYRLRTPRELREERAQEDREHTERQRVMTDEEALREAYISGDYWGKSFSDEVRKSNRELYEAFDKMDPFTRRLLIQKFDEMSFTKEATLLKSYNKDVYGFADDNIGNPFEGDDEEDGEPPF
ncbi:MAG: hypothetical protein IJ387_12120 [Thermoguttaceae bacterium]|nr:hypothetical protein [Thermoguttaceae bacterium]